MAANGVPGIRHRSPVTPIRRLGGPPRRVRGGAARPLRHALARECPSGAGARRKWAQLFLFEFDELERAESREWSVDEEDLHRDVGLDVGL